MNWIRWIPRLLPALALVVLLTGCADENGIEQAAREVGSGAGAACSIQPGLDTTYAAGNAQNGVMFDLVAGAASIRIDAFDANNPDVAGTPSAWELYYRSGPYAGFELTSAGWTLLGSASGVLSQGPGLPTPLPISVGVVVPPGGTASFYLTRTDAGTLSYTNGTVEGALFATDGNLDFLEGVGIQYPYAGVFTPRVFNGTIHHSLCG